MCDVTERAELLLPMTPAAAKRARDLAVASECTEHALDLLDDARVLVSELVTNSVRHASPPLLLALECIGDGLRVRVRDGSPEPLRHRRPSDDDEGGRGLGLVELLSEAWGVEPVDDEHGVGKAVWFELRPAGWEGRR